MEKKAPARRDARRRVGGAVFFVESIPRQLKGARVDAQDRLPQLEIWVPRA